jgi:DNA-binding NarL/FixJ family response regulator
MTTVFVARRHPSQANATQARLQASRGLHALGVAASLFRARDAVQRLHPDLLLIDLRLEDGAALSLVRELRERGSDRPRVMLCAERADDPLLFSMPVPTPIRSMPTRPISWRRSSAWRPAVRRWRRRSPRRR